MARGTWSVQCVCWSNTHNLSVTHIIHQHKLSGCSATELAQPLKYSPFQSGTESKELRGIASESLCRAGAESKELRGTAPGRVCAESKELRGTASEGLCRAGAESKELRVTASEGLCRAGAESKELRGTAPGRVCAEQVQRSRNCEVQRRGEFVQRARNCVVQRRKVCAEQVQRARNYALQRRKVCAEQVQRARNCAVQRRGDFVQSRCRDQGTARYSAGESLCRAGAEIKELRGTAPGRVCAEQVQRARNCEVQRRGEFVQSRCREQGTAR
ncbi:hypothetical protein J6590_048052 [Homalodisca vitripennis]|nr:hypothetical protein J6590_048052 [Homalodisca vitripennis]